MFPFIYRMQDFGDQTWLIIMSLAIAIATLCIFIRCGFRVVELSDGFNGKLANQQESFMVLEGLMMVIAAIALTIYNPGECFQGKWVLTNYSFRSSRKTKVDAET
jgi:hypothetical protein